MQENTRIQLQIYEERNNHLANLIQASNGLMITLLVGVLAFVGSVPDIAMNPFYLVLIVGTILFSLVAWRAYAHWVDNDVIHTYGKILCCEYKLNVEPRTSLFLSLVNGLPGTKKKELLDLINSKQITKAYDEMFLLIEGKNVGDRGHLFFDRIALALCVATLVIGGLAVFPVYRSVGNGLILLFLGVLIGFLLTLILVYRHLPIAKNPA